MKRNGFTLMELLIATAIGAAILIAVSTLVSGGLRSYSLNRKQVDAQEAARSALVRVARYIREAQPSNNGSYAVASAGAQSLTFYGNVDNDSDREQVRIFLSGTSLNLGIIQPVGEPATYPAGSETVSTVVSGVRNGSGDVFTYYDENYTGTQAALAQPVTIQSVRLVHIALSIDPDLTEPPSAISMETSASFRNLKDNL